VCAGSDCSWRTLIGGSTDAQRLMKTGSSFWRAELRIPPPVDRSQTLRFDYDCFFVLMSYFDFVYMM